MKKLFSKINLKLYNFKINFLKIKAKSINKSLAALGDVVHALTTKTS